MKERTAVALTALRLAQGAKLCRKVSKGEPIGKTIAEIVALDIADGVFFRWKNVDGEKRRAADSIVDSAILTAGLSFLAKKKPVARPYIGLLAMREAFVGAGWAIDLARTKQVKKGDVFHKLPPASIAAFAIAASRNNALTTHVAGITAVGINAALAYDYYGGWTQPERNTVLDSGVHEIPGFYAIRQVMSNLVDNTQVQAMEQPTVQYQPAAAAA